MTGEGDPRERNERLHAEWRQAHDELTQKVPEWFVAATAGKQLAVPPIDACAAVAATLLTIKQRPEPSPGVVALKTKYRAAQRAAQKFHSAPSFGFGEAGDRAPFGYGPFDDARAMAQENARQMECELSLLGAQKPQDPIRSIADAARKAWQKAGRIPRSLAPDAPLCKFVERALEYLNMRRSTATISEVLRERRRRPET
jgi:hypothetical protein